MQTALIIVSVLLVLFIIVAILFIKGFYQAVEKIQSLKQGSLLYDVTRHERPEQLKSILLEYQHLKNPDWDSFLGRSLERMVEILRPIALTHQLKDYISLYNHLFFVNLDEPLKKRFSSALLQEGDFLTEINRKIPGVQFFTAA